MNTDQGWRLRLAVLATLVKKAPFKPGRTALMKFAYLLQTVRHVPLGYRFELYNYGPYDSTLLGDISQAVTLKAIKSEIIFHSSGYGYEYTSNEAGYSSLCKKAADDLAKYEKDIDWVLAEFGNNSASRLELISTIILTEREMKRKNQNRSEDEICRRIKSIKPHFEDETISAAIEDLDGKKLISVDPF